MLHDSHMLNLGWFTGCGWLITSIFNFCGSVCEQWMSLLLNSFTSCFLYMQIFRLWCRRKLVMCRLLFVISGFGVGYRGEPFKICIKQQKTLLPMRLYFASLPLKKGLRNFCFLHHEKLGKAKLWMLSVVFFWNNKEKKRFVKQSLKQFKNQFYEKLQEYCYQKCMCCFTHSFISEFIFSNQEVDRDNEKAQHKYQTGQ